MPWIIFGIILLICKLPDLIADIRYNNTTNKPNLGKMIEDKYSGVSTTQIKKNIADGKYNRKNM